MSTDFDKLREIFLAALEQAPDQRDTHLSQLCGGDEELRRNVAVMLKAHAADEGPLDRGVLRAEPTGAYEHGTESPGTVLGHYKLLEKIGEGGMGTVWMARQTEPVKRLVGVKLIKAGMDSKQVIARFEAERQALAIMDHPNIARVFDGGATPSGRPYFVMELVKGVPIVEFCDQNQLTPRQRLELFTIVCQAVQHAHHKGIIHRDLKPSNILVVLHDTLPVPKVIDFGIAKALGQELTDKTLFTGFAQTVGTPLYMSPEQAGQSGLDIDTRSDVYSLGVLLYELLTGTTPFDEERFKQAAYDEILRIIREEEPPKPSTRLSESTETLPSISARRQTEPAKLTKLVRGELDWIVMKALEKDRSRRYETANGFAVDVRRYLNDEPVQACPPSVGYRLRKFAQRNKAAVAVAALVLFFLVLLGSGIGWAVRDRAARRAKVAGQVELVVAEVDRSMKEQKWAEALGAARRAQAAATGGEADAATAQRVRELLKELEFIDRLEQLRMRRATIVGGQFDHAGADREYAQAFREYGVDVDGLAVETSIDRLKTRPALAIPLTAALDDWVHARRMVSARDAAGWKRLVAAAHGIDPEPLRDRLRSTWGQPVSEARDELRRLADSIDIRAQYPATLVSLAYALQRIQLPDSTLRLLRDAQYVYPGDFWLNFELGTALHEHKDYEGAIRFYTAAVSIRPNSAAAHNNLGNSLRHRKMRDGAVACFRKAVELDAQVASFHSNLGYALRDLKKLDDAIAACRKAIEIDPNSAPAYIGLGAALADQKKLSEAVAACRKALSLDPNSAFAYTGLGNALRDQKKLDEALTAGRKALSLDSNFAPAYLGLGNTLLTQKKLEEGTACYRRAIELDPGDAHAHSNLGFALSLQDKLDTSIAAFQKALSLDPNCAGAYIGLGNALHAQKKPDEGVAAYRKAIEVDPGNAVAYCNLGHALRDLKKLDEAIAACRKAIEIDPAYANAYSSLGSVLYDQKKLPEAIAAQRKAIELDPNFAQAHHNLGAALLEFKKLDEAVAAYRKAVELDPNNAAARQNLGAVLNRQKKADEAIAAYRKAVELDPNNASRHHFLGLALHGHGKLDEAIAAYRKAIELDPRFSMAYGCLGDVLLFQKKLDEAIAAYRKAIELDAKLASAHYHLGLALSRQNKWDDSIAAFREAIRLKPGFAPALDALARRLNAQARELATHTEPKNRDPERAVKLAKGAVELAPKTGAYWNTLGMAQSRAGNWKAAIEALDKSMGLRQGGDGIDWFFLAMAHWQLGDKQAARKWYTQAAEWTDKNQPRNEELRRIRAEATEVLRIIDDKSGPPSSK